jgi:preprotein translocase subunit SecE
VAGKSPAVRASGQGAAPGQATKGGLRVFAFFRASWAELQRVQWPDRPQVAQATAVVLGFVIIAGAYLGLADAAAQKVIDFIL